MFAPISTHGFIYPAIGLARRLRERGHECFFVTGKAFAEAVAAEGFVRIPCGDNDADSFAVPNWPNSVAIALQVAHVRFALDQRSCDGIVTSQLAIGPLIAGQLQHLPVAVIGIAAYLWTHGGEEPLAEAQQRLWHETEALRILGEARAQLRVTPVAPKPLPLLGDCYLLRSVPQMTCSQILPENVVHAGTLVWEPATADPELDQWLSADDKRPIVYAQIGRSFMLPSAWPPLVEALRDRAVRVVASVSRLDVETGDIPPNFFVRENIVQAFVMPHASAVITTGHATPVLGALRDAIPLVLAPNGSGSPETAALCARAGVAAVVDGRNPSADALASALDVALHDAKMHERCGAIATAFRHLNDGFDTAADAIEKLLSQYPQLH